MKTEIDPHTTPGGVQYDIWKNAPNPMLVFVRKMDVTPLVRTSRRNVQRNLQQSVHYLGTVFERLLPDAEAVEGLKTSLLMADCHKENVNGVVSLNDLF